MFHDMEHNDDYGNVVPRIGSMEERMLATAPSGIGISAPSAPVPTRSTRTLPVLPLSNGLAGRGEATDFDNETTVAADRPDARSCPHLRLNFIG
jgi:hypothetical protein